MRNSIFKTDSLSNLFDTFDRMAERTFNTYSYDYNSRYFLDKVYGWSAKDDTTYTLSKDIPGVSREDLKVEVDSDVVTITAKNATRDYKFSTGLPEYADKESLTASLKDGVLTLTINKTSESTKKTIPIT